MRADGFAMQHPAPGRGSMTAVVLVAAALAGLVVVRLLLAAGGDPTGLVAFGEDTPGITAHAREVLGREVVVRRGLGHDGRFYFVQAEDPWHRDPDRYAVLLDRPAYRSQRMLYPLLAGLGGFAPAGWLPWTMTLVNATALVTLAAGVAAWSRNLGASSWWGLAVFADIGILFEVDIAGAGVVALAAAVWGTLALDRRRPGLAAFAFTLAVLSREVMIVWVAGVVLWTWWRRAGGWRGGLRRRLVPVDLVAVAATPVVVAGAWAVYLRLRLPVGTGAGEVQEIGLPFVGMAAAVGDWLSSPGVAIQIVAVVAVCIVALVAAVRRPSAPTWAAAGFAALAVVLTHQVWWRPFDIGRAVAPVPVGLVMGWLWWRAAERIDPSTGSVNGLHGTREPAIAGGDQASVGASSRPRQ